MMAHKWIAEKSNACGGDDSRPTLVLNCDDDVFVEIFHLIEFVSAVYGEHPRERSLVCDVVPSGTAPRRTRFRREASSSSRVDIAGKSYPDYCSGMAYLMTPDLAGEFLGAAEKVRKQEEKASIDRRRRQWFHAHWGWHSWEKGPPWV